MYTEFDTVFNVALIRSRIYLILFIIYMTE